MSYLIVGSNCPSTWWLEGASDTPQVGGSTSDFGLKKSHSSISLKAHGQDPVSHHVQWTLVYGWAKPMFQSTS
jgi:hypothetical protein